MLNMASGEFKLLHYEYGTFLNNCNNKVMQRMLIVCLCGYLNFVCLDYSLVYCSIKQGQVYYNNPIMQPIICTHRSNFYQ